MPGRFDTLIRQTVFDAMQVTAVQSNDVATGLRFFNKRVNATANTGYAGHFRALLAVKVERDLISQLCNIGTAGAGVN